MELAVIMVKKFHSKERNMLGRAIILLTAVLCSITAQVYALGLGEVTLDSTLNQPLQARIELLDLGEAKVEDINVRLASVEDFQRFDIDRSRFLSNVRFDVETIGGRNFVILSSSQVVREPYLSFILDTSWPSGRLLSEHTLLLDLPVFDDQQETAAPALPVSRSAPQSAAVDSGSTATGASNQVAVVNTPAPTIIASPISSTVAQESAPAPDVAAEEMQLLAENVEPAPVANPVTEELEELAEEVTEELVEEQVVAVAEVEAITEPITTDAIDGNSQIQRLAEAIEPDSAIPDSMEISDSDTLWDVALRVRPDDSVSVQQTMLAIQRLNPDAFAEGNINRLLSGEVIDIPDLSDIRSVDQEQAIAEVSRQNQASSIGVEPLTAPANGPTSQNNSQQGQLSVVTADSSTDNSTNASGAVTEEIAEFDRRIAELENRLALSQENADRAEIEQQELSSRLGSIELQIDSAQEILDLQDLQLAQLQESLANGNDAVVDLAQNESASEPDTETELDAVAPAASIQSAASTTVPPATSTPGFLENILATLEENIIIAGAGVGLVVLLLVMLMLRRNRDDEFEEAAMAGVSGESFVAADDEALTQAGTDAEESLDNSLKDLQVEDAEADLDDLVDLGADLEEDVLEEVSNELNADAIVEESPLDTAEDVLEQVAVFTQYQQLDEAKDLLENRLIAEPDNAELRLKLAEIYADQQNQDGFAEQESLLETVSDPAITAKLLELKSKFPVIETDDLNLTDYAEELTEFDSDEELSDSVAETDNVSSEDSDQADSSFDSVEFDSEVSEDESADSSALENTATPEDFSFDIDDQETDEQDLISGLEAADSDSDPEGVEDEEPGLTDDEEVSIDFTTSTDAVDEIEVDQIEASDDAEADKVFEPDNMVDFEQEQEAEPVTTEEESRNDTTETNFADVADAAELEAVADVEERDTDTDLTLSVPEELSSEAGSSDDDVDEIESFDFELESLEGDTVVEKPMFSADSNTDSSVDDFDFDLDEFEVETEVASAAEQGTDLDLDEEIKELDMELSSDDTESTDASLDGEAIDFDLNSAMDFATEVKTDTSDKPDYSGSELENLEFTTAEENNQVADSSDDDYGDMDMLSEDDEAATKLELAYAYQKMGDDNGAREILQEIITEGSGSQINEAQELLNNLGPAE